MSQSFKNLLPITVNFISGESPSPAKFNGIFTQITSAFTSLQSFIGNGNDTNITVTSDRKYITNISSLLGNAQYIYNPSNLFASLQIINNKYSATTAYTYNPETNVITTTPSTGATYTGGVMTVTSSIHIPVDGESGNTLAILYKGEGRVNYYKDEVVTSVDLTQSLTVYRWQYIVLSKDIDRVELVKSTGNPFTIKSLIVTDLAQANMYNKGWAMPAENSSYWSIAVPCKYANPANVAAGSGCASRTGDYCIGNTYDVFDSGVPVPNGSVKCYSAAKSYVADSDDNNRKLMRTLQSGLLLSDLPFALKYKPFAITDGTAGTIETNKVFIYDTATTSEPVCNPTVYATTRPDIVYITDTTRVSAVGVNNRYIVLGGDFNITSLFKTILSKYVKKQISAEPASYK